MNIDDLLASPEGKTLEFKRDFSSPGPVLRSLVTGWKFKAPACSPLV